MTREEAVKCIRYCMCEGRLVGNTKPIIDEKWQAGVMAIKALEQETGHWIMHERHRECSECGVYLPKDMPRNSYCPNCGTRMEV